MKYQAITWEKYMKEKIMAIVVVLGIICCFFTPTAIGETDEVQGTFTPISTGVAISCNKSTPAFGNIDLGSSAENVSFNVTNDGDTNCSVTMTAQDGAGTWDLVAGTSSPATNDEYCINMNPNATGYLDVFSQQTVASDLPPSGVAWNYTHFDLKVFVSDYTTEGTPGQQTFYANLTASAIS